MKERLQKILSARGVASRRKAEEWILAGRVQVDGRVAGLGDQADPALQTIAVDGRPLPASGEPVYIMLNKPRGVVTTLRDQKGRPDAAALVAGCGCRVWPVGRLDMDSEGLLLFTNDGDFSQMLTHPSHQVDKRYRVWVRGYTRRREEALRRPVSLDGYTIRPPGVRFLHRQGETACLEVVIHEGRNRQIRRMCGMAGLEVTRLQRVGEGPLRLGGLPLGAWRYLTPEELTKTRHELLATKPADLAAMAGVLRKYAREGKFCTFSGTNGGA